MKYLLPLLIITCCSFATKPTAAQETESLEYGVIEKHVMVPMRDGVKLSVYLYIPKGEGPWPALLEQRYANARSLRVRNEFAKLASHGYVVALQNFRGSQLSEGTWVGYRALGWGKLKDGYDTVEWLAQQKWCTGKIGTFGSSQAGYAQNFLAVTQPPSLTAQYMIDTGLSLFQEGYRIGGTTRPNRFKGMGAVCRVPEHNDLLMQQWYEHPHYDRYWKQEDCARHFDKMNVPCMTIGSWYDFMCQGSVESYIGRQHRGGPQSQGNQKLLVGPWLHGRFNKGSKVGELQYPENAEFDLLAHMVQWFDHYLKGKDNGANTQPNVRYYKMGATQEKDAAGNQWIAADDWPVQESNTSYFLNPAGKLSQTAPTADRAQSHLISDPLNPVSIPTRSFPGARDARAVESQENVLTFTSPVLPAPVEWTGHVTADLFVRSTAKDTDFIVRVSDVYPDGRSILIVDYIMRARYREGFHKESLLVPGKVHRLQFHVGWLSQVFNTGHQIRVTVLSTGSEFFEPNPNTGEPLTIEFPKNARQAINTILHSQQHPSRIIVPQVDKPQSLSIQSTTKATIK
jgi:predicted acyl esterase